MPRLISRFIFILICLAPSVWALRAQTWKTLTTGIDTNLRGISATTNSTSGHIAIWASGSHGVILRSLDNGATWIRLSVAGQPDLDFRGIVSFSDTTAYLMSSGEGDKSHIYKTTDGGQSWRQQYTDSNKSFFLDSIACVSEKHCFALGDPIDGKFLILRTIDGQNWKSLPQQNLPPALAKEGAFAASNSNLLVVSQDELFLITGGFNARVLHTLDAGKSWTTSVVPIAADNASSGIFAITRSAENQLVAVGGDYANPNVGVHIAAVSSDNAKSWQPAAQQPAGYRSAVVAIDAKALLTTGPTGSDISNDSGLHWKSFSSPPLNALFALDANHVYGAGPKGTINKFLTTGSK